MAEQVIDASIAIKWVVKGEPFRNKARQLLREARVKGLTLIGPPLLEYEVESTLQRRLYRGRASMESVDASLRAFYKVFYEAVKGALLFVRYLPDYPSGS
jgi:hypothetical protein